MLTAKETRRHDVQLCVVGGGLAGLFAAVSAARHGARVLLMQDRPMLGGNASSEIRMWVRGAHGMENRETGLLQEVELENIYRNPTMNYSIWDSVLYQLAREEKNLTLLLNTTCLGCEKEGERIVSVTGWQLNSYTFHTVRAELFMDCSGDSILADLRSILTPTILEGCRIRCNYEFADGDHVISYHKTLPYSTIVETDEHGVTYDILYDILIKQTGELHSDWTGVPLDVEAYRNVVFEPYDLHRIF